MEILIPSKPEMPVWLIIASAASDRIDPDSHHIDPQKRGQGYETTVSLFNEYWADDVWYCLIWSQTYKPSQWTRQSDCRVAYCCCMTAPPSQSSTNTQPECQYFFLPQRVEGWVALGTPDRQYCVVLLSADIIKGIRFNVSNSSSRKKHNWLQKPGKYIKYY